MQRIKSLLIWSGILLLVFIWLPMLVVVRITERDKTRYRTGFLFRKLGKMMSKVNPFWKVTLGDIQGLDDRKPYVMVSNHLSNADIPVISNLPWEMKWVAKRELFNIPIIGWMMKMAGDIPVDRNARQKVTAFKMAMFYLRNRTSVIFFPEGTRSRNGKLGRFSKGAFELAIREQTEILPMVIEGTHGCLPKKSWVFKPDVHAQLYILDPVPTRGLGKEDVDDLMHRTRDRIAEKLMELRNLPREGVDAYGSGDKEPVKNSANEQI